MRKKIIKSCFNLINFINLCCFTDEQATPSSSQINILEDDMILTNIGLELAKRENIGVLRNSALMSNSVQGSAKDEDEEELYGD